jgi:nucleoside-diphosphate-sugar epimerase
MKIFVTGNRGYIGTQLIKLLKEEGHTVTGCDLGLYDNCEWENYIKPDKELIKDIRELGVNDLKGYDVVMHLAAISNDPMGDLDEEYTYSVNLKGSVNLAKMSKAAGVPRFLFSGSCSVYGKGDKLDLDELATLNPVSAYAISKVEAEKEIGKLGDDSFSPTYLRNSTAYGYSPMLRIDLVVNNLLACAFTSGDIRIMSDGTPWRPLIHCKDIARAFLAFANAPREIIYNKTVNIGANNENYQVKDVADKVKELIPNANIVYTGEIGEDPRNYRVNFDLLNKTLPDFKLEYSLSKGMDELFQKYVEHKFSLRDFEGDKFVRLRTLKKKINQVRK